jgi:hypothetical protein
MKESLMNVGLVCDHRAPKPGKYSGQEPHTFVGKYVKLGFPAVHPHSGVSTTEHMWVKVTQQVQPGVYQTGEELVGTLDNDPIYVTECQCGDEVAFKVDEIEEVLED